MSTALVRYLPMTFKLHPLWKAEKLFRPTKTSSLKPNTSVMWLSHHIPKTAGSSLRISFEQVAGRSKVFGVYAETGATEMSQGLPIWTPANAKFIHGHFRPHRKHKEYFPNAKRIVWLRDPIERIWSLVGHLLSEGDSHPHYKILNELYISNGVTDKEEIVFDMIKHYRAPLLTRVYARYFAKVPLEEFEFVGSVHRYSEGLSQLEKLLNLKHNEEHRNIRNSSSTIPVRLKTLKPHLAEEYDVVENHL